MAQQLDPNLLLVGGDSDSTTGNAVQNEVDHRSLEHGGYYNDQHLVDTDSNNQRTASNQVVGAVGGCAVDSHNTTGNAVQNEVDHRSLEHGGYYNDQQKVDTDSNNLQVTSYQPIRVAANMPQNIIDDQSVEPSPNQHQVDTDSNNQQVRSNHEVGAVGSIVQNSAGHQSIESDPGQHQVGTDSNNQLAQTLTEAVSLGARDSEVKHVLQTNEVFASAPSVSIGSPLLQMPTNQAVSVTSDQKSPEVANFVGENVMQKLYNMIMNDPDAAAHNQDAGSHNPSQEQLKKRVERARHILKQVDNSNADAEVKKRIQISVRNIIYGKNPSAKLPNSKQHEKVQPENDATPSTTAKTTSSTQKPEDLKSTAAETPVQPTPSQAE